MLNAGHKFPGMHGGGGGGWLGYHQAMSYLELSNRMQANEFDFEYNIRDKQLSLMGALGGVGGWIIVGCHTIREDTMQYGEDWVKKYALALAKCLLGRIRKKFSGVQLLGGGTIDESIGDEGIVERDALEEKLRRDEAGIYGFFLG